MAIKNRFTQAHVHKKVIPSCLEFFVAEEVEESKQQVRKESLWCLQYVYIARKQVLLKAVLKEKASKDQKSCPEIPW